MNRAIFAAFLLGLGAATGAFAQIRVTSLTSVISSGQAMAECRTEILDSDTFLYYDSVAASCAFYDSGAEVGTFSCSDGIAAVCKNTFQTIHGDSYTTYGSHGVNFLQDFEQCDGYNDPFGYGTPIYGSLNDYPDTYDVVPLNGLSCWIESQGGLATTESDVTTTLVIFPKTATVAPGHQVTINSYPQARWNMVQGPGQIDANFGTYTAPASVSGTATAVVQGCNIFEGADCDTATITVTNASVTVTPSSQEVLPATTSATPLKAVVTPDTTPPQAVTWTLTPGGIGSLDSQNRYVAPANDSLADSVAITAKACSTADPTLCGSGTINVPKILFFFTGSDTLLAVPGNNETLGVNVTGSVSPQDVNWNVSNGIGTTQSLGFDTAVYNAPPTPQTVAQTAKVTACLKNSLSTCGTFDLQLLPPIVITSPGTWNAGITSTITITGTGFGDTPTVLLSDPNITFTYGARSNTSIVLTATVPISSGGQPMTVTVQSSNPIVPPTSAPVTPVKPTVTITPTVVQLREGQTQTFTTTCTVAGTACTAPAAPNWSASQGTVSPPVGNSVVYTAPASLPVPTSVTISACWSPTVCVSSGVTITVVTVTVSPQNAVVNGCSTKAFSATVTNASPATVNWNVIPTGVGNIDQSGLYTAPCPVVQTQTQIQVQACSMANPLKCNSANVTLVPVSVTVSPTTANVQPGGTQQFSTVVLGTTNLQVSWSLTPPGSASGNIDVNGVYQAPSAITTVTAVTVTATSKADNVTKGTAQVNLVTSNATLSPSTLTFAAQDLGTTSTAQAVTLSNPGTASFSLTSITTTGDFSQTNNCGAAVGPGASCTINVQFTPTAIGARTGTLRVADNAPGNLQIANLSGTGRGPGASPSPSSLDFGGQRAGFASPAKTVTFTNTGTSSLSINSITVTGDYVQTNNCGASLAAGASCTISVSFSPAATSLGQRPGTLVFNDNGPSSPQTVSLTGAVFGGSHDSATCDGANGWAWDSSQPNTPINVYIFDGNYLLATVYANQYRADLVGAYGNGYHGFSWPMLPTLRDGQPHSVTIRFSPDYNAVPMPGSPKSVTCAPTPSYQGYQDAANCQIVSGWGWDSTQPNTPIDLYIFQGTQYLGTVTANQYRQDLFNSGIGNGYHAFIWTVPSSLVDGQPHSLSVQFGSSSGSQALNGSPMTITCSAGQPPTASIAWIQPAESSWGPAGTLTVAGYAANGTGGVQLFWQERSSAGVWSAWSSDAYEPVPGADTNWSNTISSGNPTNTCHWFNAYVSYSGVNSAVFQYTGAPGCP